MEEAQRYIGRGMISGIYAGVSGTHISCVNSKEILDNPGEIDDVTPSRIEQLMEASLPTVDSDREVLHIIPTGYGVDGLSGVRNPVGLHAKQVEVEAHVVTGDAVTLKNTVRAVQGAKVDVHSLVLQSLASAEATLTGDEREMGVVLVDIGGATTDLTIYRQGNPWYSAVVPVGGDHLTKDLSVAVRTPWNTAEEMKVKWGNALPELVRPDEEVVMPSYQGQPRTVVRRRDLSEPLHARMVELLKLVLLKVRQSGLRQVPIGGLVLTGGGAELAGIKDLAVKTLGAPVRIAYPSGIVGLPSQLRKPIFSTAVGLLLWGIKHQGEKRQYGNGVKPSWTSRFQRGRTANVDTRGQKVGAS